MGFMGLSTFVERAEKFQIDIETVLFKPIMRWVKRHPETTAVLLRELLVILYIVKVLKIPEWDAIPWDWVKWINYFFIIHIIFLGWRVSDMKSMLR